MSNQTLNKQIPFYLAAGILFLLLKLFHNIADHDALQFLLWPTSKLVAIMTTDPGNYLPETGYFHKKLNIIINKSCSGFNFWLICFLMLYSLGIQRIKKSRDKALWLAVSLFLAYGLTFFVNSARILIATFIKRSEWIPKTNWLHQAEGVFTYLFFLILIFLIADFLFKKYSHEKPA